MSKTKFPSYLMSWTGNDWLQFQFIYGMGGQTQQSEIREELGENQRKGIWAGARQHAKPDCHDLWFKELAVQLERRKGKNKGNKILDVISTVKQTLWWMKIIGITFQWGSPGRLLWRGDIGEVTLCQESQGRAHLGRFRSKKGHGEFGLSQVNHMLSSGKWVWMSCAWFCMTPFWKYHCFSRLKPWFWPQCRA